LEPAKYSEAQLVENRAAVLLFGGTAAERQAWAEESAERLGSAATLVAAAGALPAALAQREGVVYVADALALGDSGQHQLVVCLQTQEERPKLVVGMQQGSESALSAGLRPDLHYRLRLAQVNLDEPGLREEIAKRRSRRSATRPSLLRPDEKRAAARAPPSRPKPARRPVPAKVHGKRPKARRAPAKRSRR
jgi:hypothetical protein